MRGQFFILGAILVCILFFSFFPFHPSLLTSHPSKDLTYLSKNIKKEIPKALNLGLKEKNISKLFEFSEFVKTSLKEKYTNFCSFYLISFPQSTGINLTIGNFLCKPISITLKINGKQRSFNLKDKEVKEEFFTVSDPFTVEITFNNETKVLEWRKNKVNLYSKFSLKREDSFRNEEIQA